MNSEENKPKSLQLEDNIFHLDLHPSNDLVVTGMINGRIQWSVVIEKKTKTNCTLNCFKTFVQLPVWLRRT